ncbi:MAG: aldo/keto reductase, partial [Armatimonadota bacterium]
MKKVSLGTSGLEVSRLGYGAMRIAGSWNPQQVDRAGAHAALRAAYDAGYTLFDHADIYARGICESLHGELLGSSPDLRRQTIVATKCGIRFKDNPPGTVGRYDFSAEHIESSCEQSLNRLRVETIDLYQLHRPDLLMHPEEVAEAFASLRAKGKVRYFGVSNFLPSTVDMLQSALGDDLLVNQIEVHLKRLDPFFDGTLDQCLRNQMTPLAWSPLGGGSVLAEWDFLQTYADQHEVGQAEIALAWLMRHPAGIIPIIGTRQPQRIAEQARACDVELSREEW